MNWTRTSLLLLFSAMGALASPPAQACACCDIPEARTPIGWSDGGDLLVLERSNPYCHIGDRLEVWTRPKNEPDACYSSTFGPEVSLPCESRAWLEELEKRGHDRYAAFRTLGPSDLQSATWKPLSSSFGRPATALPAHQVRVRSTVEVPAVVSVLVRTSEGDWTPVWTAPVRQTHHQPPSGSGLEPMPLEVSVWPAPAGGHGVLEVAGWDDGRVWQARLFWIDLPQWSDVPAPEGQAPAVRVSGTAADSEEPWLNLRSAPVASAPVLAALPDGTRLVSLGQTGGWREVQVFEGPRAGVTGYVSERFLAPLP